MKNKKNIVKCVVKEIKEDKLVIMFTNKIYEIAKNDITDYNTPLSKMFHVNKTYKFVLTAFENNSIKISYKDFRPKLIKNRTKPIPTLSGFKNVNQKMHNSLKEYKLENEKK